MTGAFPANRTADSTILAASALCWKSDIGNMPVRQSRYKRTLSNIDACTGFLKISHIPVPMAPAMRAAASYKSFTDMQLHS